MAVDSAERQVMTARRKKSWEAEDATLLTRWGSTTGASAEGGIASSSTGSSSIEGAPATGSDQADQWGNAGRHRLVPDGVVGRPADCQRQDRAGQPRRQRRRPEAVAQVAAEREGEEAQGSDTEDKATLGGNLQVGGMGMGEDRDIGDVRRQFRGELVKTHAGDGMLDCHAQGGLPELLARPVAIGGGHV